jgi:membrane protease YdiL (CAAX protease family)
VVTPIGAGIRSPFARTLSVVIAAAVLLADYLLLREGHVGLERIAAPVVGLAGLLLLAGRDPHSLGLRLRPERGYLHWAKVGLVLLLFVGAALGGYFLGAHLAGREIPLFVRNPAGSWHAFRSMCLEAPLVEEAVYRFVLCAALVPVLRGWSTVLVSGFAFAGLHFLYGNVSPENQIGGFLLAWAYLRSGSVVVPLAFHSIGNLVVLLGQVLAWTVTVGPSAG